MKIETAVRLARVSFGVITGLLLAGLVLTVLNRSAQTPSDWGFSGGSLASGLFSVAMFSFALVGVLIASRQPRNSIGWILLAIGLVWQLSTVLANYDTYGLVTNPGGVPGPDLVLALQLWLWVPGVGLIGTFLVLLFPDGHLPSPRWRPLAWVSVGAMLVAGLGITFGTSTFAEVGYPGIRNPLAVESLVGFFAAASASVALIPLCILGCALSLILRFRRSKGRERLQLKWLAAAVGAAASLYAAAMVASFPFWGLGEVDLPLWVKFLQEISLYSFVLIPVAVGMAILRYRLYNIDRIINRALVYAALTAMIGGVYALLALGSAAVGSSSKLLESDLVIAAMTLTIAAAFRPLRRRTQSFIDHRFYRSRYDAGQTAETFSARLRDEVDLDSLREELLGTVNRTLQPTHASLWLRQ